jgi:REP element-mobilizing transposase RayT
LISGGIYHVYNRVSHGEHVFRDDSEVERFLTRLAEAKRRDAFQILAWCVMSNHYHLALRMGEVVLSRSMWTLHQRFSQSYNGRHNVLGPFWQGRYRSKLVEDGRYLQQLVVYIHLNPVCAGLASEPGAYRWSGHREVLGVAPGRGLIDVDETLAVFEPTRQEAMARYRSSMVLGTSQDWIGDKPGRLPWWRIERFPGGKTEVLVLDTQRPLIGMDGLYTGFSRPRTELVELLALGASHLGVSLDDLRSGRRTPVLMDARMALAWVAVELHGFRVKDVAAALGKYVKTAGQLVSRAARRRVNDRQFAGLLKADGSDR